MVDSTGDNLPIVPPITHKMARDAAGHLLVIIEKFLERSESEPLEEIMTKYIRALEAEIFRYDHENPLKEEEQ